MDGQSEQTHDDSIYRANIAFRGKKWVVAVTLSLTTRVCELIISKLPLAVAFLYLKILLSSTAKIQEKTQNLK